MPCCAVRYGLGPDPFDVRNNILAGAAYLREMHDRYGRTGMLAAYNAGPGRWEEHITQARPLPLETVAYVARLAPMIGAHGLPRQGGLQVASASGAPQQVLFVSRRDSASVETASSSSQVAAATSAPAVPPESVFVRKDSAVHQHVDDGPSTHLDCAPGQPLRACRWLERRPVTRSGLSRALSRFGVRTGGGQGWWDSRKIGGQDERRGTRCAPNGWQSCALCGTTAGGVVPCFRCDDARAPFSTAPCPRAIP